MGSLSSYVSCWMCQNHRVWIILLPRWQATSQYCSCNWGSREVMEPLTARATDPQSPWSPWRRSGCVPPPVAVGDLLRAGLSSCGMPAHAAAPGAPTWRWHLRLGDWHAGLSPFLPLLPRRNILWPRKLVSSAGACGATGFHALLLAVLRIIGLIYVGENRDK